VRAFLSEDSVRTIEKFGTSVIDVEKDNVTPLNNDKECAYVVFDNGIARCAIEKLFLQVSYNSGNPFLATCIRCV